MAALRPVSPIADLSDSETTLVPAALRCWRAARDAGAPVQQRLHKLLAPVRGAMLAPAFDSLLMLYELALGRRLVAGQSAALSADERMLLGLLDGAGVHGERFADTGAVAAMLDSAVRSTRVLLARARRGFGSAALPC